MKKELRLIVDANKIKNQNVMSVLMALEEKGWLKNGKIVYDEEEESEVFDLITKLGLQTEGKDSHEL